MKEPIALSRSSYNIVFGWRNKKHFGLMNRDKKTITIIKKPKQFPCGKRKERRRDYED